MWRIAVLQQIDTSMKRILFGLSLLCLCVAAQAQRKFVLDNSGDGMSALTCYLPATPTGRAVIDCPGGGYSHLAMDHEGHDWAAWFNERGIAYFVLQYRMPDGDRSIPLGDAEHAIRLVRDSASAWGVNPHDVGLMGFSAGGHLASAVATHADYLHRPDFTILFYPVITLQPGACHEGSARNFLGQGRGDKDLVRQWSSDQAIINHLTPQAFICLANDDGAVPPLQNGVSYYWNLRRHGINASLHVYPSGGHGFGFRSSWAFHDLMLAELDAWLRSVKAPREGAVRVACIGNSITDGMGIDLNGQNGYPAQLQALLGDGYVVGNFGVSARTMANDGDRPYMREPAWRDAKQFQPDIVVLKLGTNDSKPDNWRGGNNNFEVSMQAMIDTLEALPSRPRIIVCAPIPAPGKGNISDSTIVDGVMPVIGKVARKNRLECVDLHAAFKDGDGKQMQRDGIHPTRQGAAQLARIIEGKIKKK